MNKKIKVLYLDLDTTVITTLNGNKIPQGIWDMKLRIDVINTIKNLHNLHPLEVRIVSNQDKTTGYKSKNFFKAKLKYVSNVIQDYVGCKVKTTFCATLNTKFRMPNTGMLESLDKDYTVNDYEMLMIGGNKICKETAKNFKIEFCYTYNFVSMYPTLLLDKYILFYY